jgi:short-subunit dehydrogenase
MKTFAGKKVLITGGARGVGLALGRAFGAESAVVLLADLDPEGLEQAVSDLESQGVVCRGYRLDVTDPEAIEAVRARIHEDIGAIDVLVNNAGVVFGGPFLDVPLERHLKTYRVNVDGVVAMTHAFLQDVLLAREGHLVNVASASGFVGLPYGSTYASSKWAVIGFSESIRLELKKGGHDHVGVTTVCPLYVDTGMFEGAEPPMLTRFLTPEELAHKVLKAVKEDEPFVLEPWLAKLMPALSHALPKRLSDLLSDVFGGTTSMRGWKGH